MRASPHKGEHSKLSIYINRVYSYYWLNITEVIVFWSSQYQNNDFDNLSTYFLSYLETTVTSSSFIIYSYSLLKVLFLTCLVSFPHHVNRNVLKLSLVRSLSYCNTITFLAVWLRGSHYDLFCEQTSNLRSFCRPFPHRAEKKGMPTPQVTSPCVFTSDYGMFKHYVPLLSPLFLCSLDLDQNRYCFSSWSWCF